MGFPYKKTDAADIAFIREKTAPERVWVGEEIPSEYYHDEMPEYGIFAPDIYVEVLNKEEVSAILKYASEKNIPVTARGAGTGLAGGATCKYGGILLSVMKMNHILTVDEENLSMTVEPGVLLTEVAEAAREHGMFYPPDPGEKTASIGGTVLTNAGGMRAVRYGLTRDYVRAMELVLPNGNIVNLSSNVVKNTTGLDVKDLIIGSEGILGIVTQITLKLIAAPNCSYSLVVPYDDLEKCIGTVPKLLNSSIVPTAIEFIEEELLEIVERQLGKAFPDHSGKAYLILMIDGSTKEAVEADCDSAADICLAAGALDVLLCNTEERIGSVWGVRGAVLEGMKADTTSEEECDVVVPRSKIAEYVLAAKRIGARHRVRIITVGHAGDGNIHTEILRDDLSDEEWKATTDAVLRALYAKSKELGGQLSGEHGIGNGRLRYLKDFVGEEMYEVYKNIKIAFDPVNILNPGKMIEVEE